MSNPTYELVFDGRAIKCLICGTVSWHPRDISERYCGLCHRFHEYADQPSKVVNMVEAKKGRQC